MERNQMGGSVLSAPGARMLQLDSSMQHASMFHHHQHTLPRHLQGLSPLSIMQNVKIVHNNEQQLTFNSKGAGLACSKGKSPDSSDEEEPNEDVNIHGTLKKGSPWQRMKWTASMVRLLIQIVLLVGEDDNNCADGSKKKPGLLQKKGKWKSVSRMMNGRGCYVSPQQCEDKFNDLNKRYKRLNDILGKGIACCVVENPSLLDTMDNLSLKAKDSVRKILSSNHLFYEEMCSYHTGCKSLMPGNFEFHPSVQAGLTSKSRDCMEMGRPSRDNVEDDDEDGEDEEEEDDYEDEDEDTGIDTQAEVSCDLSLPCGKRRRFSNYEGPSGFFVDLTKAKELESMTTDVRPMPQNDTRPTAEKNFSVGMHLIQLEEHQANLQAQAIDLEKQRFKWQRFCSKKYRELERKKLNNKRMKLENERISLQLKERELEIESKRSQASMTSIDLILDRLHNKQIDLG